MPTQKIVMLYKFEELSEESKKRAREWYRQCVFSDHHDWSGVYEDAKQIADILGITFNSRSRGVKRRTLEEPQDVCIYWSGFSNQGDGACFEGRYEYKEQASHNIRQYAPKDEELHRIADALQELQSKNDYHLRAKMTHHGNYYHQYNMTVEVELENDEKSEPSKEDSDTLYRLMRDFAVWIYKQLEKEYYFQMEDSTVEENIKANEYTFLENGRRED